MTTITVVSGDERWGAERIRLALSEAGYTVVAVEVPEVRAAISRHRPALIVANLSGVPAADLDLCHVLRDASDAPIMAIGSDRGADYQIAVLDAGVDAYLMRPINPRELVLRLQAILRRQLPAPDRSSLEPAGQWLGREQRGRPA